ncbi:hypothetical protein B0H10DRAFT_1914787 [Mycena sp. CBHHK59/15]|nr:hypothetical protein B0H10DRAFT_1914787 [Mycena sp. CBHHK59/15]
MAKDEAAAEELKDRGNAFFKSGNVTEASKCYAKAEGACPTNPVYPSNLSAALFEEGDYISCVMAINRCWKLLGTSEANPSLATRLSGRLAKALAHGFQDGSVSQNLLNDVGPTINDLEALSPSGQPELACMWQDWNRIAHKSGDRSENSAAARKRFSELPVFRKSAKPIMEYHNIGQDPVMSLVDDWGPEHKAPLKLRSMSDKDLSQISLLLGGVGDARHVYGTLVGLHRAHQKLGQSQRQALRVHITLLDIHPAALTRDICMLLLLEQLMHTPAESSVTRAEILSALFYTFAGVVMPGYCFDRLEKIMNGLKTDPQLPSWIHVDSNAISQINTVIDFWTSVSERFTAEGALQVHTPTSPAGVLEVVKMPNISPEFRAITEANIASKRQEVIEMINGMTSAQLARMGLAPPGPNASAEQKRHFAKRREDVVASMMESVMNNVGNMNFERMWYEEVKIFMPPPELWARHPGVEMFPRMIERTARLAQVFPKVKAHVNATWKPNPTLFDPAQPGYPNLKLDPFEAPGYIDLFNQRFGINSTTDDDRPDAPSYGNFVDFFGNVAASLKELQGQIKLEILCGELTQELSKMRFGGDHTRPANFPRAYTRAHLSNVPDYTHGVMNTALYALPSVEEVASNCFLNTGIWANDEEFIHTYTLLKSADLPKYLGCRVINQDAVQGLMILGRQKLPLPLTKLASRVELVTWLSRVLIYTVLPSSSGTGSFRARLPNNLVAFVSLLIHLRGVGYPAHWLADFLQAVLSGTLVTDISPYTAKWPIPVSDTARRVPARQVRLDPWCAELESILAVAYQGIPFSVSLPADYATQYADIAMFEATVEYASDFMGTLMGTMVNPIPVEDPIVCLLFYKPGSLSADEMVTALPKVLDGGRFPAPGTVCVLTAQEKVDVPIIRWRLSKARVERMREKGWVMAAYRTDVQLSFTSPVPASNWRQV